MKIGITPIKKFFRIKTTGKIFLVAIMHTSELLNIVWNWQTGTAGTDRITEGDGKIRGWGEKREGRGTLLWRVRELLECGKISHL